MQHPIGMVHGRFQPLHKEHLQYILTGIARCSRLIIGITNPDPGELTAEPLSPHRHRQEANPYTYFQRTEMIRECFIDEGVDLMRVSFAPFHLFQTDKWRFYLPAAALIVQYVRAFSAWEDSKIDLFRRYGFQVEIIDQRAKKNIEGIGVRQLMGSGGDWRSLVPRGTARVIDKISEGQL